MSTAESQILRVGLAYPGDVNDPATRSGSPYGVLNGLRARGVDVVTIDARPSPRMETLAALATTPLHQRGLGGQGAGQRLRLGYGAALQSAPIAGWRTATASRRVRRMPDLDVVVQIGAGFRCRTEAPVVVHDDMTIVQALQYPYPGWTALRHGDVARRIALQRRVYNAASAVCVESTWAARSVIDDYGVLPERVHVVATASSIEVRQPDRTWDAPRFLFVGLDFERKNGPRVLRVFEEVHRRYPDAQLDVVGGHPKLAQPGVTGHGVLRRDSPAGRAAVRALFDAATCLVMPSLFEPGGVVFTEAAAAGIASIGGDVGGSADLIGEGGVVVDPHDDDQLLEAMTRFCDPAEARSTGAVASARAQYFTWPALADRLLASVGR